MPCPNSPSLRVEASRENDMIQDTIECFESLNSAICQAHGGGMTVRRLRAITAFDLLLLLAPNHIKFTYSPPNADIANTF